MSLFLCSWYPLTLYGWLELAHNLCKYNKHSKQFLRTFNTEGGAINPFNCVVINLDSTKQTKKVCCQAKVQTHLVFHEFGEQDGSFGFVHIPLQSYNFVHQREKPCQATNRPEVLTINNIVRNHFVFFVIWFKIRNLSFTFGLGVCDHIWGSMMIMESDSLIMTSPNHYLGSHIIITVHHVCSLWLSHVNWQTLQGAGSFEHSTQAVRFPKSQ